MRRRPGGEGGLSDARVVVIAERGNDGVATGERLRQIFVRLDVELDGRHADAAGNQLQRFGARVADENVVVAGIDEEPSNHPADLAGAE